jgi:hypothetical protein
MRRGDEMWISFARFGFSSFNNSSTHFGQHHPSTEAMSLIPTHLGCATVGHVSQHRRVPPRSQTRHSLPCWMLTSSQSFGLDWASCLPGLGFLPLGPLLPTCSPRPLFLLRTPNFNVLSGVPSRNSNSLAGERPCFLRPFFRVIEFLGIQNCIASRNNLEFYSIFNIIPLHYTVKKTLHTFEADLSVETI